MNNDNDKEENKCPICQQPGVRMCSGCSVTYYCSPSHQKQHWPDHKHLCRPFIIKKNETFGRYLVAARDLPQGTIVLTEGPLVVGPKRATFPVCLGCHKLLEQISYRCSTCHFPLCAEECETLANHAENECEYFANTKIGLKITSLTECHPSYESIMPLRCLQVKHRDEQKWKKMNTMAHLSEERKEYVDVWHRNAINVVKLLKDFLKYEADDGDIHRCIGFIDVNSFEVKSGGGIEVCALYPEASLMSHDCTPNTHHASTCHPHHRMIVRTSKLVKKGEIISTSYADLYKCTVFRRDFLLKTKYFDCFCKRCVDATESGTFFSCISCTNPSCNGNLIIEMVKYVKHEPYGYICDSCGLTVDSEKYEKITYKIQKELEIVDNLGKMSKIEKTLKKLKIKGNSYLAFDIRMKNYREISDPLIKKGIIESLLEVMEGIEPGMISRQKAVLHFYLYQCDVRLLNEKIQNEEVAKEEREKECKRIISYLQKAKLTLELDRLILDNPVQALAVDKAIDSCYDQM